MRRRSKVLAAAALSLALAGGIAAVVRPEEPPPPTTADADERAGAERAAAEKKARGEAAAADAERPAVEAPAARATLTGFVRSRLDASPVIGASLRFRCGDTPREVKSGAGGRFELTGAEAACAVESIAADGYQPFDPTRAVRARSHGELAFWLDPIGGYTVVVLGEDQRPISGARVQVWKRGGEAGDAQLADRSGEARVRASAGDNVSASAAGYEQRVRRVPKSAVRIEIQLPRAAAVIEGRVLTADGKPVLGATVTADTRPPEAGDGGARSSAHGGGDSCSRERTGPDGRFALACPIDADFTVRASHDVQGDVAIGGVHTGRRDVVLKMKGGPSIKGCVVHATGEPGAAARVTAKREGEKSPRVATADAAGCFIFANLEQVDEYALTATVKGLSATVDSIPPGSDDVLIELPEEARVHGRVREAQTGAPITSFVIRAVRHSGGSAETVAAASFLDADGAFELGGLGPGEHELWATSEGYLPSSSGRVTISGPPGPGGEIVLTLEKSRCVSGVVMEDESGRPIAGAMVDPRGMGRNGPPGEGIQGGDTDAAGEFRVCTLSGERQSLFVSAEGYTSRLVSGVEAGDTAPRLAVRLRKSNGGSFEYAGVGMRLDGNESGRLMVHSVFPESPAARASIAAGDEVISIDGHTFDPKEGVSRAIERILGEEGTPVRIGLKRASTGTREELTITRERIQPPS